MIADRLLAAERCRADAGSRNASTCRAPGQSSGSALRPGLVPVLEVIRGNLEGTRATSPAPSPKPPRGHRTKHESLRESRFESWSLSQPVGSPAPNSLGSQNPRRSAPFSGSCIRLHSRNADVRRGYRRLSPGPVFDSRFLQHGRRTIPLNPVTAQFGRSAKS
jgi:hypothetical protein